MITIIAILVSLLLPALAEAKFSGRRAVCVGNQRQVYLATVVYEQDFATIMPMCRQPLRAFGIWANSGYVPGTDPLYFDPRPETIGFGLLTWNDYVTEQELFNCADTEFAPLSTNAAWTYPHLALTPDGSGSWHTGHRPSFTFPMKGKQKYLVSGKVYGGVSSYAMRRWDRIQFGYNTYPYIDWRPLRTGILIDRFKTLMVCNQKPNYEYEICHLGRGSNLLFMDGSVKWGDFRGKLYSSYYAFDYAFGGFYPGNSYTNIWAWAESNY